MCTISSFRLGVKEAIKTSHWIGYTLISKNVIVHSYTVAKFDHLVTPYALPYDYGFNSSVIINTYFNALMEIQSIKMFNYFELLFVSLRNEWN